MNFIKLFSIALFAILFSGCATDHKEVKFQTHYSQYNHEVSERTRSAKLYLKLETVMIVDAIFIDKGLREAWVRHLGAARRFTESRKTDILAEQMEKDKSFDQFILAIYTSEEEWNDFADKDSRWTILLDSGAGDTSGSVTIKKVKLDELIVRDYISFNPRYRTFYKVNFPKKPPGSHPYNITISGPLGEITLGW